MQLEEIDLSSFRNALSSLRKAIAKPKDEFIRDSVIQRFEYTFELSWKSLRKYFISNNKIQIDSLKNLFREAAKQNLINDLEAWFTFLEARNQTVHTYDSAIAEKVYEQAVLFENHATALLKNLEKVIG